MRILAIETSCDETAAAVIEKNGKKVRILSNVVASQIDIHKKFGGVFPEHASRAHTEHIVPVAEQALLTAHRLQTTENKTAVNGRRLPVNLIAVTTGPGLIGSLLIGVNFAKTFAYVKNKPIIGINHWLGHIYSNWLTAHRLQTTENKTAVDGGRLPVSLPKFPALILIVSGGHTGLVLMKSHNNIVPLGETLDDAAGEAFDKVAKLLDLGYPGGPAISAAAEKYKSHSEHSEESPTNVGSGIRQRSFAKAQDDIKLPRPMLDREGYDFSFSGLKTSVLYESKKHKMTDKIKVDMAASFQQAVIDILVGKTIQAAYEYRPKSICLCGGVSANKNLREELKKAVSKLPWKTSYFVPPMALTTDNAAMIGIAAAYHLDQKTSFDNIKADSNLKL